MTAGPRKNSLASIWARRLVSVPVYLILAAAYLVALPALGPLALLVDLFTGNAHRRPRTRAFAFFGLYLGCEVFGMAGAAAIWLVTLGGRVGGLARFIELNRVLQAWWAESLFRGSLALFSMNLEVEGMEFAEASPFLLFVRHASTADTVLAATLIANPHRTLLRYVLKNELLWDPCLDIVGRRLPNTFVDRNAGGQGEIAAVASLARDLGEGEGVLIYPEGTRFSPAKRERALAKLREAKLEPLVAIASGYRHVLPPKLGGPLALLDAAPGTDVLFAEHTGFEGASSIASFWRGDLVGKTVRVRVRRFPSASIPTSLRDRWLYDRWAEMDAWIHDCLGRTSS